MNRLAPRFRFHLTALLVICAAAIVDPAAARAQDHGAMGMNMGTSAPLAIPSSRAASGTSWQPDSTPGYGEHFMPGAGWMLMAHYLVFGGYDYQGSRRGGGQPFSTNWGMLMAQHELFGGTLMLRGMLSLEAATDGGAGYPLLLQSGEAYHGVPLHDRQHPHDLFMELAFLYTRAITDEVGFQLYGGPVGEPALGPSAFPHRESASADPFAPLTHHWMDSSHISFGVVTAGLFTRYFKLEGSWFNGREPDANRWDFDFRRMDSFSGRFTANPTRDLSMQVSYGFLKSPEELEPDLSVHRVTASVTYNRVLANHGNWATTAGWGRNIGSSGKPTDGLLLESTYDLDRINTFFVRAEYVRKTGEDLFISQASALGFSGRATAGPIPALDNRIFDVGEISLGYVRDIPIISAIRTGAGVMLTMNFPGGPLFPYYRSDTPMGVAAFVRIRPSRMGTM